MKISIPTIFVLIFLCLTSFYSKSQEFRENYYDKIFATLSPEYQKIMAEAEKSITDGKPFEIEGLKFRSQAEIEEQKQDTVKGEKLNDLIKRENKLFKKSTVMYAVAADLYSEATYIKYNLYYKTLTPLEMKAKGDKRKKMLEYKKQAGILFNRANFTTNKARNADRYRPQFEYYSESIKLDLEALNMQAAEFKLYYEWTD
jgi:hypothetical protein